MNDVPTSLGAARALKASDNRLWTPVECLRDVIHDIESERVKVHRLLVLRVNTDDEKFDVGYSAAGAKGSEILAMLECAKAMVLQEMGYIE